MAPLCMCVHIQLDGEIAYYVTNVHEGEHWLWTMASQADAVAIDNAAAMTAMMMVAEIVLVSNSSRPRGAKHEHLRSVDRVAAYSYLLKDLVHASNA